MAISSLRKIGRDSLYYLPSVFVPAIVALVEVTIYTSLLGPEQYGAYILVISTVSLILPLVFGWLRQASVRYYAAYRSEGRQTSYFSTAILSTGIGVILVTVSACIAAHWGKRYVEAEIAALIGWGILVLSIRAGYEQMLAMLRARQDSLFFGIYSSAEALLRLGVAVVLIRSLDVGAKGILWAASISAGAVFLIELARLLQDSAIQVTEFSVTLLRRFFSYGFPLVGDSVGTWALSNSDRYVLNYYAGAAVVGVYSAGYNVAEKLIRLFSEVVMRAVLPVVVETFEKGSEEQAWILLHNLLAIYLVVMSPVALGIAAVADDFVRVFFQPYFWSTARIMPWVAAGAFCLGVTRYLNKPFELKEKTSWLLYVTIFASVVNVGINLVLVPRIGVMGAAYATLISYFTYCFLAGVLGSTFFTSFFPWSTAWKAGAGAAIMYGVLACFSLATSFPPLASLTLKVVIGSSLYALFLFALRDEWFLRLVRTVVWFLWPIRSGRHIDGSL